MPPRRRRKAFPIYPILRAIVVLLFLAAIGGAVAAVTAFLLIDPNAHKTEVEAAVLKLTGRTLELRGPMRLAFGLPPSLVAEDIVLSNPPGASRAQMIVLERAEARVALWPLLSGNFDLTDLTLIHPDVLLERDADGRGNWLMAPAALSQSKAAAAAGHVGGPPISELSMARTTRSRVAVQSVHIEGGRIGWRPVPGAATAEILLPHINATAGGLGGTMMLAGTVDSAGRVLRLSGSVGSIGRLFDRSVQLPWPVQIELQDAGARVSVSGSIAEPTRARGMSLLFEGTVTDFSGLETFLPPDLPPPHDANVSVRWGDGTIEGGDGLLAMTLHLGGLRLPHLLPGVDIAHVDVEAPGLDRPVHVDIEGSSPSIGALRFVLNAAFLGKLLPGAHAADALPIDATLDAGRALISAKGTLADPSALKGADLDVFVRLPDVAAFGALAGRRLPALEQVAFEGHLIGDLTKTGTIGIRKATLTLPEAQLAGDADIRFGLRPFVHAGVSSQRIDLDSLIADLSVLWNPDAPDPGVATGTAPVAPAPPPLPRPSTPRGKWLIPDTPIDYAPLDRFDADMDFRVDSLQAGGVNYAQVAGHALLRDGKLVADPLTGTMPGGPAEARLTLDSRAPDAPFSLFVNAPSLQLAQLAATFGGDGLSARGTVMLLANLQGAGRTPHAIVGSLDGHLGVGSVDSELDNRLLVALLRLAKLPEVPMSASGTSKLRCIAVRLSATKGVATVDAMVFDMLRLAVLGGGSFDLGQETLALQLRPMLRLGNGAAATGIVVPVRLSGSFQEPKAGVDLAKLGPSVLGAGVADPCAPAVASVNATAAAVAKASAAAANSSSAPSADGPKPDAASPLDVLKELIK